MSPLSYPLSLKKTSIFSKYMLKRFLSKAEQVFDKSEEEITRITENKTANPLGTTIYTLNFGPQNSCHENVRETIKVFFLRINSFLKH